MLKTSAEKARGFTDKTLALIEEIIRVNLQSFRFDKEAIVAALKSAYAVAKLNFPEDIIFCTDWTDDRLLSASSASSAFSAFSASSASSASSLSSAFKESSASSASRAFRAFSVSRASIDYD